MCVTTGQVLTIHAGIFRLCLLFVPAFTLLFIRERERERERQRERERDAKFSDYVI